MTYPSLSSSYSLRATYDAGKIPWKYQRIEHCWDCCNKESMQCTILPQKLLHNTGDDDDDDDDDGDYDDDDDDDDDDDAADEDDDDKDLHNTGDDDDDGNDDDDY